MAASDVRSLNYCSNCLPKKPAATRANLCSVSPKGTSLLRVNITTAPIASPSDISV